MSQLEHVAADKAAEHYRAGLSWEADAERKRQRSEHRAWLVAGAACVLTLVAVTSLSLLAPLRRTVPYLYVVDKASGNVEFVGAIDERAIKGYQELLDKHWVQRYVTARESYSYRLLQQDYDTVLAMSEEDVARDYARLYDGPNARDKKFGNTVDMTIVILSLRPANSVAGDHMVVRFSKTVRRLDSNYSEPAQQFVATVRYSYLPSMAGQEKDLLLNPLGFKVGAYRVDAELAATTPAASVPVPATESPGRSTP